MRGNAFVMVTRSHVRVFDVSATCVDLDGRWRTASGNGMFFVWAAPPVDVVDDVEFYRCRVVNAHTHGFNMNLVYRSLQNGGIASQTLHTVDLNGFYRLGDISGARVRRSVLGETVC
jgi:hypothetical protein